MALFHMRRLQPAALTAAKAIGKTPRVAFQGHSFQATSLQAIPLHSFGSRSFSSGAPTSSFDDDKFSAAAGSPIEVATDALNAAAGSADYLNVADLGFGLSDLAIRALDAVHMTTGLPWWATVIATTFAIRTAMLPITLKSLRNSEKMKAFQPEMEKIKLEMDQMQTRDPQSMQEFQKKYKALMKKHDVNPFTGVLVPLSQIPVFLGFFWGLQDISKYFPDYATGGDFWFTDLSMPDPLYALPVMSSALMIASIEMGADAMPAEWGEKAKFGMRLFGLILIPISVNFQSGVLLYWVSSNAYTLLQTSMFRLPPVRRALGLSPARETVLVTAGGSGNSPFQAAVARAKEGATVNTFANKPKKAKKNN